MSNIDTTCVNAIRVLDADAVIVKIFSEYGHVAKELQPVDMFSEISHIECMALLEKK